MKALYINTVLSCLLLGPSTRAFADVNDAPEMPACEKVMRAGSLLVEGIMGGRVTIAKYVNESIGDRDAFQTACKYWKDHPQDSAARAQLTAARDKAATSIHVATETKDNLAKRLKAAFSPLRGLGLEDCSGEVEGFYRGYLQIASSAIPPPSSLQCAGDGASPNPQNSQTPARIGPNNGRRTR